MELHNGTVMYLILLISAWEEGGLDIKIVFIGSMEAFECPPLGMCI